MDESGLIRVSDDDRERYAVILRRAYAEGRITGGELEDRLQHVYRSRTDAELQTVVADLPVAALADTPVAQRPVSRPLSRVAGKLLGWYFPAVICTAIWAITDFGGYFWPIWVFFGLSIPAGFALVAWLNGEEDGDSDTDAPAGSDDETEDGPGPR
ncbi:MAG: DUF1707 domain-containing protein [Actinomycetota bacterium]